ncbi:hypothetical protein [Rubripirellula reticaptiva]|uniref:Uncharacterized protein n=1 Tax=Rubripirellula reticaptiva TaxID=2528013 RepID=A0A5C6F666_9BACT|nr:hypothetical protein [Rubripirellula reticaptiva]TWU55329.1 hypothetical protein Poly59_16260 [Rubripirellula reticaptiva]
MPPVRYLKCGGVYQEVSEADSWDSGSYVALVQVAVYSSLELLADVAIDTVGLRFIGRLAC